MCDALGLTALVAALLVAASAQAQIEVGDGPIDPVYYFSDNHAIQVGESRAAISWEVDPNTFIPLVNGSSSSSTGAGDGEFFSFPVDGLEEVLATNPDLVRPIAMSQHPDTGHLWITDYGADKVMGYDPENDTLYTVYSGSEANGPWGIGFLEDYSDGLLAVVSNRDNNTLLVLRSNGSRAYTWGRGQYQDDDLRQPAGILDFWGYYGRTGGWEIGSTVLIANYEANTILRYSGGTDWRDMTTYSDGEGVLDGPIDIASGYDSRVMILNQNNHTVTLNRSQSGLDGNILIDGTSGLSSPTTLVALDLVPDPLNLHPGDSTHVYRSTTGGIYIADTGNDRVVRAELDGSALSDFLDGIDSPVDVQVHYDTRDLYILTSNEGTGSASLLRYKYRYTGALQRDGGDNGGYLAIAQGEQLVDSTWNFNGEQGGEAISMPLRRGDTWPVFLGWDDPAAAEMVNISATQDPGTEIPSPTVAATGPSPGVIEVTATMPGGTRADMVSFYMLTGCQELWTRSRDILMGQVWPAPEISYEFPNPMRPNHLRLRDAGDCLRLAGTVPNDPSGVTTATFSEIPWVPDVEYCFVAVAHDSANDSIGPAFSEPSEIDTIASCERPPNATRNGVFCNHALPAAPYRVGSGYPLLPLGHSGTPTWYEYTVPGASDELRQIILWIDDEQAENALITIYDGCEATGGVELAEGRQFLDFTAHGGDHVKIRVVHYEVFPAVLRMLDLSMTALSLPTGLTATTDRDGEIEICWDLNSSIEGLTLKPELLSFEVARGPVGQAPDTLLHGAWRRSCLVDADLGPNESYDYTVTAKYATRLLSSQTIPVLMTSTATAPVQGSTTAVDVTGTPVTPGTPSDLQVQLPNFQNQRSVGTQVWWETPSHATSYRVVQTDLGSGAADEFVITGGARAADLPMADLSRYCYDVYAQRTVGETTVENPTGVGYSTTADPQYCVNLCEDGVTTVNLFEFHGEAEVGYLHEFRGPVRYYQVNTGDFTGQIYTANYSGRPAEACAWQGSTSCDSLSLLGCAQPNLYGNSVLNLMITDTTDPIFVKWELLPLTPMTPAEQQTVSFPVEFGFGVSVSTNQPQVAMTVVGTQCATQLSLEYLVTNWTTGLNGYINFVSDGNVVATEIELSGVIDLPVDPTEGLHELTVQLYDSPLEIAFTRRQLVPAARMSGDVDFNCIIDVLDAVKLINHILGIVPFLEGVLPVADYTGDGLVDISDVVGLVTTILDAAADE